MRLLRSLLPLILIACAPKPSTRPGPATPDGTATAAAVQVRFATYNVAMYRDAAGGLIADLAADSEQASFAAAVVQEVRPDVLLLNEIDHDPDGEAVRLLRERWLEVGQDGREPIVYEHVVVPEVNTGVASGHDLDANGVVGGAPGSSDYAGDSWGYGTFPGQYGFAVLSRYPVVSVRSFRTLRWVDMPDAWLPEDFYDDEELSVVRLSSKSHVDIALEIDGRVVHLLASHPTPPTFDGAEDRNGRRNHDEIRFWAEYVDAGADWPVDDDGLAGGPGDEPFVIAGDLNADPHDGDSSGDPMEALLGHPRIEPVVPTSAGGAEQATLQGGRNGSHLGDPAADTADFEDGSVGNLRIDYVLPSTDLAVVEAGVFWPVAEDPLFELVGTYPFPVSDHRLVWVDVLVP